MRCVKLAQRCILLGIVIGICPLAFLHFFLAIRFVTCAFFYSFHTYAQGEKAGEILRFLTFRLDFNDFHLQQRAYGGGVGLTSTPPAHLKSRPVNIFSTQANSGAGAGEHTDADRLASAAPRGHHSAGSQGASQLSPTRSESPSFGPEAWTVGDSTAGSGTGAPVAKSKPKRSVVAASSMR